MEKVELMGIHNIRDFQGTRNRQGKKILGKHFLRSNALRPLTLSDQKRLKEEYHLELVIDLRTHVEMLTKPDILIPGVHYEHISLLKKEQTGISSQRHRLDLGDLPDLSDLYRKMVTDPFCVEQFRNIFSWITQDRQGAVLWHCSQGKDRCGLVSALFLAMMDVDFQEIRADYLMTNDVMHRSEMKALFPMLLMKKEKAEKVRRLFQARPEYLEAAWQAIETEYGSMDAFLERIGVDEKTKAKMQNKYMTK